MMKQILIGGYYGYGNIGDEAILEALAQNIAPYKEIELRVLSSNRKYTNEIQGLYSYSRNNPIAVINGLINSDLFISGGGGLIQDSTSWQSPYFYLLQILLAQILARKVYIMGQGIGPLNGSFARFLMAELLASAKAVVVRDNASQSLLMNLLPSGIEIILGADLALLLEPASDEIAEDILYEEGAAELPQPILVAVLKGSKREKKVANYISDAINSYHEQVGGGVLFIPFFPSYDIAFGEMVLSSIKAPKALIRKTHKPSEILAVIKSCDHVLAGRFHGAIFAAIAHLPFTSIVYDPKIKLFLDELGLDASVMTPLVGSKSIEESLLTDMESSEEIVGKIDKRLPYLKDRANLNIAKLLDLVLPK